MSSNGTYAGEDDSFSLDDPEHNQGFDNGEAAAAGQAIRDIQPFNSQFEFGGVNPPYVPTTFASSFNNTQILPTHNTTAGFHQTRASLPLTFDDTLGSSSSAYPDPEDSYNLHNAPQAPFQTRSKPLDTLAEDWEPSPNTAQAGTSNSNLLRSTPRVRSYAGTPGGMALAHPYASYSARTGASSTVRRSVDSSFHGTGYGRAHPDEGDDEDQSYLNDDDGQEENGDDDEDVDSHHNTPAPRTRRRGLDGGRMLRTRPAVRRSSPHQQVTRSQVEYENRSRCLNDPKEPGDILDTGLNLFACFDDDDTPRLRYRVSIERGRTGTSRNRDCPDSTTTLPIGLSLKDVCSRYANHVWGTGLRMFMHEGMGAQDIWSNLHPGSQLKEHTARPHNYLQQAIGRENDKMMEAQTGEKRKIEGRPGTKLKRKRRDNHGADERDTKKVKQNSVTPRPQPIVPRTSGMPTRQPGAPTQPLTALGSVYQFGDNTTGLPAPVQAPPSTQPFGGEIPPLLRQFDFNMANTGTPPVDMAAAPLVGMPAALSPEQLRELLNAEERYEYDLVARHLRLQDPQRYGPHNRNEWHDQVVNHRTQRYILYLNTIWAEYDTTEYTGDHNNMEQMLTWLISRGVQGLLAEPVANSVSLALSWRLALMRRTRQHLEGRIRQLQTQNLQ